MTYNDRDKHYNYIESDQVEEPESVYSLNRDLNLAHKIMEETSVNLFLTGKAGTGKTTFLKRLRQTSPKRMIVLAPTGVAAINAEGVTIHSFFQLPFAPFIPGKGFIGDNSRKFSFSKEKRRIIAALDLLIIDEISMVRPDTLDAIDSVLRRFRNPVLPFGGVQLLLIGDLRQLAPVLKENERELLAPYYPSEYFFDSIALKQSGFLTIELSTVYRQTDIEFIEILNAVRDGILSNDIIQKLNSRYIPDFNPSDSDKFIRLTTHNRTADKINYRKLALLPSQSISYQAVIKGNFPESSYPAEQLLQLKPGAQVMFIKNDSGSERLYYNGMIGEITGINEDNVIVRPADGRPPITVGYVEWENTKYVVNDQSKEITQITEGTFSQLPLRLAWAITIHKSQGLTFDRAIIDAGNSFAPGQTYVALSRCRSLEGLVLAHPIPISAVITDNKVNNFIDSAAKNKPDESTIDRLRAEYTRHTLAELFDFRSLRIAFDDFHKAINEYVVPRYPEFYEPFKESANIVSEKIDVVGAKFKVLYASSPILPEDLEKYPDFLEKIRNGCDYFLSLLRQVMDVIDNVNVKIDNASYVKRLTNSYENVSFIIKTKYHLLRAIAFLSFSPSVYIDAKAKAVINATQQKDLRKKVNKLKKGNASNKATVTKVFSAPKYSVSDNFEKSADKNKEHQKEVNKKEKRPVGYSKHRSFEMFKEGKTVNEIATERELAPSTIANHIGEFIASGELNILDVMTQETFLKLEEAFRSANDYKEAKEKLGDSVDQVALSLYFRGIYKPRNSEI